MGVSWVIGVPPVLIHFWLGFSAFLTIQLLGYPIYGNPDIARYHLWLVVYLPLWKIRVRQLGWWHSQVIWENKSHVPVTTNQIWVPEYPQPRTSAPALGCPAGAGAIEGRDGIAWAMLRIPWWSTYEKRVKPWPIKFADSPQLCMLNVFFKDLRSSLIYPLNMVIFHSYVNVSQRVTADLSGKI